MIRLTTERFDNLAKLEEWDDFYIEDLKKDWWAEDPIYVWGGRDEKEVKAELREKGYHWESGDDLDSFDPGWTWGYPVVFFLRKDKSLGYIPVEFGRDTEKEPNLD